jgi:hypothetical protein
MCIWDEVVLSGLRHTPYSLDGVPRQEIVPFHTGLDRVIFQTMMPIAEQIQMGRRLGPRHFLSETLTARLSKDGRRCYAKTLNEAWRWRFRQIYTNIIGLCKEHAPEHLRHAELIALCELNNWATRRENLAMQEFTKGFFSKEFWDRMHGGEQ